MRKKQVILFLTIIVMLSITASMYFYSSFILLGTESHNSFVIVDDHYGVDITNTSFRFGMTRPGASIIKAIQVHNDREMPVIVLLSAGGEAGNWVSFEPSNFVIGNNETQDIDYIMNVPPWAEFGEYNATINVIYKRKLI